MAAEFVLPAIEFVLPAIEFVLPAAELVLPAAELVEAEILPSTVTQAAGSLIVQTASSLKSSAAVTVG
jgi:hypothetical protein